MGSPQKRNAIGWHNDAQKTRAGIPVDMYPDTPVLSVSFGSDMVFWVKRVLEGKGKFGPETAAVVLRHGGVWCWRAPNRARTAHSTAPPPPTPPLLPAPGAHPPPPTPTAVCCQSQETMPDSSTTSASRATTRRATAPRACALPSCCVGAEASASTTPTRTATRPAPLSRIRKNLPCDPFVVFVFARDFF